MCASCAICMHAWLYTSCGMSLYCTVCQTLFLCSTPYGRFGCTVTHTHMNYKFTGCLYVHTQFACSVRCTLNGFKVHTIRKGSLLYTACSPEVGIRNLSPHLCNSAILRTTISIAELRTKKVAELRLRTFKSWLPEFRNSPQSPASSATF